MKSKLFLVTVIVLIFTVFNFTGCPTGGPGNKGPGEIGDDEDGVYRKYSFDDGENIAVDVWGFPVWGWGWGWSDKNNNTGDSRVGWESVKGNGMLKTVFMPTSDISGQGMFFNLRDVTFNISTIQYITYEIWIPDYTEAMSGLEIGGRVQVYINNAMVGSPINGTGGIISIAEEGEYVKHYKNYLNDQTWVKRIVITQIPSDSPIKEMVNFQRVVFGILANGIQETSSLYIDNVRFWEKVPNNSVL